MPQPHKGDRSFVGSRMPTPDAEKLRALAQVTGDHSGDIVARVVHEFLQTIDLDAIRGQETLPMAVAS